VEWLKKLVRESAEAKAEKALAQRRAPLPELAEGRQAPHHFRLPPFALPSHVQPEPCGFMKEAVADGRLFVTRDPRAAPVLEMWTRPH
jgi:hypothetical protein